MRLLFPLMLLLGVLVMLTSAVASLVLSLAVPVVMVLGGGAMVVSLRAVRLGIELMRAGVLALGHAFSFVGDVFLLLFVWPDVERELTDSPFPKLITRLSPPQFPEFHRLQVETSKLLGVRPIDELWLSPDAALGIGTAKEQGRRIRYLVVGFQLLRTLTPQQLRAALLHEFGHERGGDLWLGRWARHLVLRLAIAADRFAWFNPARWAAELSLFTVKLGYLPWSRALEFAADRCAARHAGPAVVAELLRTVKREAPVIDLALELVLERVVHRKQVPLRLGEAVREVMGRFSSLERHRLSVLAEGDPLDLGGRTHPPIALRIAAVSAMPAVPNVDVPPLDPARLQALEERLTRRWLEGAGALVPVDTFLAWREPAPAPAPTPAPQLDPGVVAREPGIEDEAPLELDHDYDWRKRQR